MASILHTELCDRQTYMLRHLMDEFHLYHSADVLSFVAQNKFCNLLVTHVSGPVDFRAQVTDF